MTLEAESVLPFLLAFIVWVLWATDVKLPDQSGRRCPSRRLPMASIPVRRSEREQRTKRPRFLYRPGERWARKQPRAIGAQHREGLGNPVCPVRIEERWRRGTVRQREVRARSPGPAGKLPFEPGVGALQFFPSKRQSVLTL